MLIACMLFLPSSSFWMEWLFHEKNMLNLKVWPPSNHDFYSGQYYLDPNIIMASTLSAI